MTTCPACGCPLAEGSLLGPRVNCPNAVCPLLSEIWREIVFRDYCEAYVEWVLQEAGKEGSPL